jgi:microcystin-dependent protein
MWPLATAPTDWIECDGGSTAAYPELAALLGATVPDLRGQFVRGWDNGKGTDSGRAILSDQADQNAQHNHALTDPGHAHGVSDPGHAHGFNAAKSRGDSASGNGDSDSSNENLSTNAQATGISVNGNSTGITINNDGGSEARPVNTALMYIIRAR